jgi:hypothetical protein
MCNRTACHHVFTATMGGPNLPTCPKCGTHHALLQFESWPEEGSAVKNPKMAVRFWDFHHGSPVRLTMHPGDVLSQRFYAETEEGYKITCHDWTHDGDQIVYTHHVEEKDCDGKTEHTNTVVCPLNRLDAGTDGGRPGLYFARWEGQDSSQRDHAAEAARY